MVAKFRERTEWGGPFWVFAAKYLAFPWHAWTVSRAAYAARVGRWYAPVNMIVTYFVFVSSAVLSVFAFRALDETWIVPLAIGFAAATGWAALLLRLEAAWFLIGKGDTHHAGA